MKNLCRDLEQEYADLDALVASLSPAQWQTETPFLGWNVYDQVAHIAFVDGQALEAMVDVAALERSVAAVAKTLAEGGSMPRTVDRLMGGPLPPEQLLEDWRQTRTRLVQGLEGAGSKERFPWYGPSMGARSFATARLMETWTHGQDVCDAVGATRAPTQRLRHVAHLGVATLAWSFQSRRLEVPAQAVRVELTAPSGELWEWGEPQAENRVVGGAEDFCRVVTRRRDVRDTGILPHGEVAERWMEIAQCFAGPALDAPPPGKP